MREKESWGLLTKSEFFEFLSKFKKKFGKSKKYKRLGISFWDPSTNKHLDTRIRITNGKPQIMQKIGKWENRSELDFKEILIDLDKNPEQVFRAYLILSNIIGKRKNCRFIQHENYIFNTTDFEIKLGKQFGKSVKYIFEIEAKNNKVNLESKLKELNLSRHVLKTDVEFWDSWNKEVNLTGEELNEKQILKLIESYF